MYVLQLVAKFNLKPKYFRFQYAKTCQIQGFEYFVNLHIGLAGTQDYGAYHIWETREKQSIIC